MPEAPVLIAALVIAAIWGVYLFPSIAGHRRNTPLSSAEQFDRWTHVMADVQRRGEPAVATPTRDIIRSRRRRSLLVLGSLAGVTLVVAFWQGSVAWLIVNLVADALLVWYIGMLIQVRHREDARSALRHAASRPHDADEPPVRIVAGR